MRVALLGNAWGSVFAFESQLSSVPWAVEEVKDCVGWSETDLFLVPFPFSFVGLVVVMLCWWDVGAFRGLWDGVTSLKDAI